MKNLKTTLLTLIFLCFAFSCSNDDQLYADSDVPNTIATPIDATSPASRISGTYKGIGKKMPNGVFLGSFSGCIEPINWEDHFIQGTFTVLVTRLENNSVKIKISGSSIPTEIYAPVAVSEDRGIIEFAYGSYDYGIDSFELSKGIGNSYNDTNACLRGMPYYYGLSASTNDFYSYSTLGHIDFTGSKLKDL